MTLNLVLLALFLKGNQPTETTAKTPTPPAAESLPQSAPDPESAASASPESEESVQTFSWETVESQDYLTYIDNLRSIGCPEETIQDIITADVNKLFEQRWKEAKQQSGAKQFEYWKTSAMFGGMNSDQRKLYKEIDDERRQTLQSLLGKNVPRKLTDMAAMYDPFDSMLGFLPESKRSAIIEAQQQMSERMMEAAEEGNNMDAADWQKVQAEQKEALAEILTPEELFEYNLRMSNSAHSLRAELGGFDVSEEEFREMFALREAFDEEYGLYGPQEGQDAQEWYQQRNEGEKELKAGYEEILGEEQYRHYQHEQTFRGSSLRQVAKEYESPREDVYQVYDATDAAQEAAQQIRQNEALSTQERQVALDQIRAETEAEVSRLIGQEAAQSYIEKGSRIRNLNNEAAAASTTATSTFVAPAQVISVSP